MLAHDSMQDAGVSQQGCPDAVECTGHTGHYSCAQVCSDLLEKTVSLKHDSKDTSEIMLPVGAEATQFQQAHSQGKQETHCFFISFLTGKITGRASL